MIDVDLGFGYISMPPGLKKQEQRCVDGSCWRFMGNELTIDIDRSQYAWHPTYERQFPSYTEEAAVVNGTRVKYWFFENQGKSYAGAVYADKEGRIGVGISIKLTSGNLRPMARAILSSLRLKK